MGTADGHRAALPARRHRAAARPQQFACTCEAGLARRSGEQAVVANAVEPGRQQVKQEAADELVDAERHDLLAVRAVAAIVLVAEGDAGLVEGEQPAVRDGDAVTYLTSAARSGRLVSALPDHIELAFHAETSPESTRASKRLCVTARSGQARTNMCPMVPRRPRLRAAGRPITPRTRGRGRLNRASPLRKIFLKSLIVISETSTIS
jgi:hypothetical protein